MNNSTFQLFNKKLLLDEQESTIHAYFEVG